MKRRLRDFGALSEAEVRLRDEVGLGQTIVFDPYPKRQSVRAEFMRYLILGGCKDLPNPVPEIGVSVAGLAVSGPLDLLGCKVAGDIVFQDCEFDSKIQMSAAECRSLNLTDSKLEGIGAEHLIADTIALWRVTSQQTLYFSGARLKGSLVLSGAILSDGGLIDAIDLSNARIEETLNICLKSTPSGVVNLSGASCDIFVDRPEGWPEKGKLLLDGFRYRSIAEPERTSESRAVWLKLQPDAFLYDRFRPYPWEQCASVLGSNGYGEEARTLLVEKERLQRRARRARVFAERRYLSFLSLAVFDALTWTSTRHGVAPLLAFGWLLAFLILGSVVFESAFRKDEFKPNNPFVLRSPEWVACAPEYIELKETLPLRWTSRDASQLDCFLRQPEAQSFPKFNPVVYSADTLLPFVDLEMQDFWLPSQHFARLYLWLHVVLGWALSLLAVAGFSGLIRSDPK